MPLRYLLIVASCVCLGSTWAHAANGIIPIGFGTESVSMGGADVAVARDTSAMNTNPAGLVQITGKRADLYSFAAFALDVAHQDQFGNDAEVANEVIFAGGGGYAQQLGNGPYVVGAGLFGQSGAGVDFPSLNTAFGTQDELTSLFQTVRLNFSIARPVSRGLSVGLSAGITYTSLDQDFFPNTSSAAPPFFGYRIKNATGTSLGPKLGTLYRFNNGDSLGVAYTARVKTSVSGNRFVSNQTALGLGNVAYRNVRATGLNLPEELAIGYAKQMGPRLLLSLELNWINWSDAIRSTTLTATNPDNGGAPPVIQLTGPHNWRDQYVFAVGTSYRLRTNLEIYAGYNRARNPVPLENTTPIFGGFTEQHFTTGVHLQGSRWQLYTGLEYVVNNPQTYTNPNLPFGTDSRVDLEFVTLHLTVTRTW